MTTQIMSDIDRTNREALHSLASYVEVAYESSELSSMYISTIDTALKAKLINNNSFAGVLLELIENGALIQSHQFDNEDEENEDSDSYRALNSLISQTNVRVVPVGDSYEVIEKARVYF